MCSKHSLNLLRKSNNSCTSRRARAETSRPRRGGSQEGRRYMDAHPPPDRAASSEDLEAQQRIVRPWV